MSEQSDLDQQRIIEDVKTRQNNTLWPDTVKNSSSVDEFLWKGSPNAPLVQRIGAWIFGIFFILAGLAMLYVVYEKHDKLFALPAIGFLLLGVKVCSNGLKKRLRK
jgi:hypothetical protein